MGAGRRAQRADHDFIRARADALGEVDAATAQAPGERLATHVRFEESELFATFERRLAPDALERSGEAVSRAEAS